MCVSAGFCKSSAHLVTGLGGYFAFSLLLSDSNSSSQVCPLQTAKSVVEAVREVSCKVMFKYFRPSWLELKFCLGEKSLTPRVAFWYF